MVDLALNSDLDVHLDETHDIAIASGKQQIEQSIGIYLHRYLNQEIGSINKKDARKRLERKARRVVRENSYVDDVAKITSEWDEDDANTLILRIHYISNELSELEFNV